MAEIIPEYFIIHFHTPFSSGEKRAIHEVLINYLMVEPAEIDPPLNNTVLPDFTDGSTPLPCVHPCSHLHTDPQPRTGFTRLI